MRSVKSKNTTPERVVRSLLRKMGHTGYRLHRTDIIGNPDIVWIGRKLAIFVNGCFWHGHNCARGAREPKTRSQYWRDKIAKNKQRDLNNIETLISSGWKVLILWECQLRDEVELTNKLKILLRE